MDEWTDGQGQGEQEEHAGHKIRGSTCQRDLVLVCGRVNSCSRKPAKARAAAVFVYLLCTGISPHYLI